MRDVVEREGRVQPNGDPYVVSNALIKRWKRKHNLKSYKTSAIDPARAAKATVELRDHFFKMVAEYIKQLYAKGKVPWDDYDKVPDTHKYNMDEEGAATSKGRAPALASGVNDGTNGQRRLFEISSDGRMSFHYSDGLISRADGLVCVHWAARPTRAPMAAPPPRPPPTAVRPPGAQVCPPIVVKSVGATGKQKKRTRNQPLDLPKLLPRDWENLCDNGAADGEITGIGIGVTASGSMTLEMFSEF